MTDDALAARMAPRLRGVHEQNGGNRAGTALSALALIRETHALDPHGGAGPGHGARAKTPDAPREDD